MKSKTTGRNPAGVLRISGGSRRGLKLEPLAVAEVRPTKAMVREAVCALIGSWRLTDATVLDLFAGSGIMALEALSRGAREAVCVDREPACCRLIAANAARAGFAERCRTVNAEVLDFLCMDRHVPVAAGIVFMDPPYGCSAAGRQEIVAAVAAAGLPVPGGVLVVEHDRREAATAEVPDHFVREKEKTYGRTMVTLFVRPAPDAARSNGS
ncbi:MAG: RsmD family RNA methyltransferase [Deltaproteobacteria bacterium]|nr:RsmD family RNA methyltransferase [Candidatus Anaeroferrophillacea bacterium]